MTDHGGFRRRLLLARASAAAVSFLLAVVVSLMISAAFWSHAREHQRYEFRLYACQKIEDIKAGLVDAAEQRDRAADSYVGHLRGYTRADAAAAHRRNAAERARFAPLGVSCETFAKI